MLTIIEHKKILGGGVWVSHILIIFDLGKYPLNPSLFHLQKLTTFFLYIPGSHISFIFHQLSSLCAINFLPDPVSSKPLVL